MQSLIVRLLGLSLILFLSTPAFTQRGYQPTYTFLHSDNLVADKNFYLLTVISHDAATSRLLAADPQLHTLLTDKLALIKAHATDTCSWPTSLLPDFRISPSDSLALIQTIGALYHYQPAAFDAIIDRHLRPSGYYQRFIALSNEELLYHAWAQYVTGINYIIDQFGLGKKMRYPRIDSATFVVTTPYFRSALKNMFDYLTETIEEQDTMTLFYQPTLAVAMQLMQLNERDEPARFEPMDKGENAAAIRRIHTTDWSKYKYATIVIPGSGPELTSTPISPINKMHCAIAAKRYLDGWAPFIIVSGGYCYPFRGPYCEAIEMRKYLTTTFGIPASAIIIDPHARHTTTNIRNADRLLIRYGIPIDKRSVFITTMSQSHMSAAATFDQRNLNELGYLPYRDKQVISIHDITFYPVLESLHMDPYDPLDP